MDNEKITDKDIYLEQLKYVAIGSESTFNMLRDILTKFFPILFYLNGGAAIAILAFIGNFVKYDDKYLLGMMNALVSFSIGAMLTALALGAAYFSQGFFVKLGEEIVNNIFLMQLFEPTKDENFIKGTRYRNIAIYLSMASGIFFLVGGIVFVCTFRCY